MSEPLYAPSRYVGETVRRVIRSFVRYRFNHDHAYGLPVRRDVADYVVGVLFREGAALVVNPPTLKPLVTLESDGTVRVVFERDGRFVSLWVPCAATVVLSRYVEGVDPYLAVTLNSDQPGGPFDAEMESAFDWLETGE